MAGLQKVRVKLRQKKQTKRWKFRKHCERQEGGKNENHHLNEKVGLKNTNIKI